MRPHERGERGGAHAMRDQYLSECVICGQPAIECCVWSEGREFQNRGTVVDFCADCIDAGRDDHNFGRCYFCRDFGDHEHCVGVPCQCPCPSPDARHRAQLIEAALAKLDPVERAVLGF